MKKIMVFFLFIPSLAYSNCLKEVAEFAERICGEIQDSGSQEVLNTEGKLSAEVSGILRKVAGGGGAQFNVRNVTESYESVLRKDLAGELFNVRDCRMKMVNVGRNEVCTQPTPTLSRTCKYDFGPKAGTTQYFPPSIPIVPALIGQPCHDGMGSSGVAIKDQQ
ncbi:hypothetical protein V8054_000570 [Vibrio parahaemolyticus]